MQRFRGGLAFKAHRRLYHSTLGFGVIKKRRRAINPFQKIRSSLFVCCVVLAAKIFPIVSPCVLHRSGSRESVQRVSHRRHSRTALFLLQLTSAKYFSSSLFVHCIVPAAMNRFNTFPIIYEKVIKLKLSGNEVYYTKSLILLVTNMLCSKLHCQKVFI